MKPRVLIACDGDHWYARRIVWIEQYTSGRLHRKIYECDEHLGGPFGTPEEAIECVRERYKRHRP